MTMFRKTAPQHGFTMIELVVVITISSIVVGFMVMFIAAPIDSYLAQSRRAELVSSSDMTASNMINDLRLAPAGSVRYTQNGIVEVLEINSAAPIAYLCDRSINRMRRYSNYIPNANIANRDSDAELIAAGARVGVVAQDVTNCKISFNAGNPLVGLQMQLTRNGETMYVFRQMAVGS